MASRVIVYAAGLLTTILIARYLGPAGKGQISLVVFTIILVLNVAALGIPSALTYYIGHKLRNLGRLFAASILLFVILVSVFSALYVIVVPRLQATLFPGLPLWVLLLALAAFPLSLASRFSQYVFLGFRQIFRFNLIMVLDRLCYLFLMLVILVFVQRSVAGVIFAGVLGNLIACLVAIWLVLKLIRPVWRIAWADVRKLLGYGLQAHLLMLANLVSYRVGLYIVSYYHDAAAVGQFSLALSVAEALLFIPTSFGLVLFSRTASSSTEEANRFTPLASRNVGMVTLVAGVVLGLVAPVLVPMIFGKAFSPAVLPFLILLPGIVASSYYRVIGYDIVARGYPLRVSAAAGAGLLANVGVSLWLVPSLGANGAALGNLVGYILAAVVVLAIFMNLSRCKLTDLVVIRREDFKHYRDLFAKLRGVRGDDE